MELFKDVLAAVALLGTGGFVGSWVHEWHRNRREDRLRWHGERRAAYERFLTAAEKMNDAELLIAEQLGNLVQMTEWAQPLFDEEHLLRHAEGSTEEWASYAISRVRAERSCANEAHDQIVGALASMEMISDPAVVEAARSYHDALHSLVAVAAEHPPRECGGWSDPLVEASQYVNDCREAFVAVLRKELGVE